MIGPKKKYSPSTPARRRARQLHYGLGELRIEIARLKSVAGPLSHEDGVKFCELLSLARLELAQLATAISVDGEPDRQGRRIYAPRASA